MDNLATARRRLAAECAFIVIPGLIVAWALAVMLP